MLLRIVHGSSALRSIRSRSLTAVVSALVLWLGLVEPPSAAAVNPPLDRTRVQLTGFPERDEAERVAAMLQSHGVEAQVLAQIPDRGFAVSAGVFTQPENAERMIWRLESLGFDNVAEVPLRRKTHADPDRTGIGSPPDPGPAEQQNRPGAEGQTRVAMGPDSLQSAPSAANAEPTAGQRSGEGAAGWPQSSEPEAVGDWQQQGAQLTGFYQNETSYAIDDPSHWQKSRHLFYLSADGRLNDHVLWKLSGWASYDPIFDWTDFYPREVRDDRQTEAMLRETYLDVGAGDWQFRLGRQHIVWGEVVGLFVADVVSAKDLREFVARDLERIRIPQWAARAEYFAGNAHAEFIWIPYVTYDDIGVPGDDYFPTPPPVPGFETRILDTTRPANTLANSSYGARISYLAGGWDLAGFYFYGYDLTPVFARELLTEPDPVAVYRPEHRRMQQLGLTAARDVGRMSVLKGELVYNHDRWFNVSPLDDTDGLVPQDFLDYIVGLDTVTAGGTQFNVQFFQRRFFDHDPDMVPGRVESGASIFASSWLPGVRLRPEFLFAYNLDRQDWLARPSVTWEPPGDWRLRVGADIFNGPEDSLFGRFDDRDRIYVDLRFDF
jgi:hypothetical protein